MPEAEIVIVGGGAAGLTTAAALKMQGLDAVVLDKDDHIGGSWARRYERLCLHTVRRFSGLAYHPFPRHYPKYVPKDLMARYLESYAARFGLKVVTGCAVSKVRREADGETPTWAVETERGTWRCHTVIIAAGHYGTPYQPVWPGQDEFKGTQMHSAAYGSGQSYRGKRVLVIGAGNSGCEIAADLVEQGAASVAVSVRTPPPIVPRDFLGTPVQVFAILMTPLPRPLADRIGRFLALLALGDLEKYGLKPPAWLPFTSRRVATIDVGFVKQLKQGNVTIRPDIERFTPSGVIYDDGRQESFDVVIAATGFQSGLDQLLDVPGLLDDHGIPLCPSGQPTAYRGLYFMGYTYSLRGHLFEANRASRRLAQHLAHRQSQQAHSREPALSGKV